MSNKSDAVGMSVWSLLLYGAATLAYSAIVYASGLGREDCTIVTDCFDDGMASYTLRMTLCAALVLSHPVTLFPASEIIEGLVVKSWGGSKQKDNSELTNLLLDEEKEEGINKEFKWAKSLRLFNVLLTLVIGYSFEDFSAFSNIVGAVGLTLVGFVFPPILYANAHKRQEVYHGTPKPIGGGVRFAMGACLLLGAFNVVYVGIKSILGW